MDFGNIELQLLDTPVSLIEIFWLNWLLDVSSAEILVPFLINSICLGFYFWKAWKSDPGVIQGSIEEKLQVNNITGSQPNVDIHIQIFIYFAFLLSG